ncbi:MAG TPA: sugar phosphate isomerase/epimerase family protein [Phycisphaerales bacterium]|nr:sugar phosphate isomerase/epimerase family protein [Phycisphaerales bacterium]
MIKPAFSTVACLDWTLEQVAAAAREWGFEAVELRTFGADSRLAACDPALSDEDKTRTTFRGRGVEILSLATSVRFDERAGPPVLGALADAHRPVREAARAVDLAVALECPLVRVFGFELPRREKRPAGLARVVGRLAAVVDHAHRTGVRVVVENGGSFPTAADLLEIIGRVGSPLLGAAYSLAPAVAAGEMPSDGIALLGSRLWLARIKDLAGGRPVPLGSGELPCKQMVCELVRAGFPGPLVFEWDRAWLPDLAGPNAVLPEAARTMFGWIADEALRTCPPAGVATARAAQRV